MNPPHRTLEGPRPARFTVDEFLQLDATGVFAKHGRTELIQGEIYFMSAQHRPHARMKGLLYQALVRALSKLDTDLDVLIEATVSMPPNSAPEPDLILTNDPEGEGPVPIGSVRLLVEVADSTQEHDVITKAALYAENGVAEYWAVDLKTETVHVMASPQGGFYAKRVEVKLGSRILSATIAGLAFELPTLS